MAKQNKQFCLDPEIIQKINDNNLNASKLVNDFFIEYFSSQEEDKEREKENALIKEKENQIMQQKEDLRKSQRMNERKRAQEFEAYASENNLRIDKRDYIRFMTDYSEYSKTSIEEFCKEKNIKSKSDEDLDHKLVN